jgi:hypothetical protein
MAATSSRSSRAWRHSARLVCALLAALILGACGSEDATAPAGAPPAEPPSHILALTARGDLIVVNRTTRKREATLASFPWRRDREVGLIYGRAEDFTVLRGDRILVSICCEPAGGNIVLLAKGKRRNVLTGWDPQVGPSGARVALGGIDGIAIYPASLRPRARRLIEGTPSGQPEDPAWSRDARQLAYTANGRLGVVRAGARSLAGSQLLEARDGAFWTSPVFTADGLVAVEQTGAYEEFPRRGPSRLVSVDLATSETVELASAARPIRDVSVDPSGRHLVWAGRDGLRWSVDGVTSRRAGNYVAAVWLPPGSTLADPPAWATEREMQNWQERHDAPGVWLAGFFLRPDFDCARIANERTVPRYHLVADRELGRKERVRRAFAALEGAAPPGLHNPLEHVRLRLVDQRLDGDTVHLDFAPGISATNGMGTCGGSAMAVQLIALVRHYFPKASTLCIRDRPVFHDSVACPVPL